MKYLIILLICSGLISCRRAYPIYENEIVTTVDASGDYFFFYTTGGCLKSKRLIYNVGDTIKFTK